MTTYVEQVGGTHYGTYPQHWDVMDDHDISYLESSASGYIVRWDLKGTPVQDLEKARSYLVKMRKTRDRPRRFVPLMAIMDLVRTNGYSTEKNLLLELIHLEEACDITLAISFLDNMIERERLGEKLRERLNEAR